MISFEHSGSFRNTEAFLQNLLLNDKKIMAVMHKIGAKGVKALADATPKESSRAAKSWSYEVEHKNGYTIYWKNSDIENGFPVAIMLQYGHGTGRGGYVRGKDYINPAIRPIFDEMAKELWKAVIGR